MRTVDTIREAFDTSLYDDPATAFSFTEAVAEMIDAASRIERPDRLNELFGQMWRAYAELYTVEHGAALQAILGDKYQQVVEHKDTRAVMSQVLARIHEKFGGMKPGITSGEVDVEDILEEAGIT